MASFSQEFTRRGGFWKFVLLFALLHYAACLLMSGLLFLLSHVPPKAVNLDQPILGLFEVENVLQAPRSLLLRLWHGESTPRWWSTLSTVGSSLMWGAALTGLRTAWRKLRS